MSSNPVANGGYDGPLSPIAPEDDVTFALSPRATFEKEGPPHVVTVPRAALPRGHARDHTLGDILRCQFGA